MTSLISSAYGQIGSSSVWWFVLTVNVTQNQGREDRDWRTASIRATVSLPVCQRLWAFIMIWQDPVLWESSTIPQRMGLSCKSKLAENEPEHQPVMSLPPQFWPWVPTWLHSDGLLAGKCVSQILSSTLYLVVTFITTYSKVKQAVSEFVPLM